MTIARLTPWAINGPAASYGLASSLAGTSTNVPAGALSVTSVQAQTTTQPTVSDTAGNVYTVVKGGSKSGYLTTWIAYCLSCIANTANVVTWAAGSAVLSGAQGAVYTTSSGTWSFDKTVGGVSAYATALSLSLTTAGGPGGVVYGGFGEYYVGADTWAVSGLTSQASQPGSSSGNGQIGCLLADTITGSGTNAISTTVSDANGGYGGYIAGVLGSFTFGSGGTASLVAKITQSPRVAGSLQASQALVASIPVTPSATGALQASQALAAAIQPTPAVAGVLAATTPMACGLSVFPLAAATLLATQPMGALPSARPGVSGALSVSQALAASIRVQPEVAGTFTITIPGLVALTAAISVSPGLNGTLVARQGFAGATLLEPSVRVEGVQTQGLTAAVEVSPQLRAVLTAVVPGVNALVGAITIQPGARAYLTATQRGTATPALSPSVSASFIASNRLQAQASPSPSVAGLWTSFLRMGSATAAPFGVRGTAYAWQTLVGDIEVSPQVAGSLAVPFTGWPVDPNFYLAMPARSFTITMEGRVLYVAMPARSLYLQDNDTMAVQTFPATLDPAESDVLTVDKTQDLMAGELLVSLAGALEVTTLTGTDATPSTRFGVPVINTAQIPAQPPRIPSPINAGCGVQFPVTDPLDGCSYLVRQPCTTSTGRVVVVKGVLKVTSQ